MALPGDAESGEDSSWADQLAREREAARRGAAMAGTRSSRGGAPRVTPVGRALPSSMRGEASSSSQPRTPVASLHESIAGAPRTPPTRGTPGAALSYSTRRSSERLGSAVTVSTCQKRPPRAGHVQSFSRRPASPVGAASRGHHVTLSQGRMARSVSWAMSDGAGGARQFSR